MRAKDFLIELWTQPYKLTYQLGAREGDVRFNFTTADDRPGRVDFQRFSGRDSRNQLVPLIVRIDFYVNRHWGTTGGGDAIAIFSTVVKACQAYFNMYRNKPLIILTETDDPKKRGLYARMVRYFPEYELYPNWAEDPVVGNFIDSNLSDNVPEDAVILKKRDYDPSQFVADTDQYELHELAKRL